MKATEQTENQIVRFIRKVSDKFPAGADDEKMTDIHLRASQDSGDLMAFDDDDQEITRCVVDEWINNKEDKFYDSVAQLLRRQLQQNKSVVDHLGILKPYSFVLEDDEGNQLSELYIVDDDIVIIGGDLMKGMDKELDAFFEKLME